MQPVNQPPPSVSWRPDLNKASGQPDNNAVAYPVDGRGTAVAAGDTDLIQPGQAQTGRPVTYPSGLQMARDQGGVAFQAVLPAGPFLPVAVTVQRGMDGRIMATRFDPQNPEQPVQLNAGMAGDGKIYIQMDPSNPTLAVFDPTSLDYGLTAGFQRQGDGSLVNEKTQLVSTDGTTTSIFNEQRSLDPSGQQVTRFTRVVET
ncbi:MAG: hypothetical protein AB1758_35155, partial [Candidatus Eremiobacterota bacterium]